MGIAADRPEVVATIEARGGFVDRVDDDELASSRTRGRDDGGESPHQQLAAKTLPVKSLVQRELGQQDRGDPVWSTARDPAWQLFALHHVRSDREVAYDQTISVKENIGARALASGIASVVCQPIVELRPPTLERAEIVTVAERLDEVVQAGLIRGRRAILWAVRLSTGALSGSSRDATSRSK
jgi:hypothetical protein